MRSRLLIGAWVMVAGCHERVGLPSLDLEGVRAMLVVQSDDNDTKVIGFDLEPGVPAPVWTLSGDADIYTMGFGCALERLGLEAGLQERAVAPEEEVRLPQALFEREVTTGQDNWRTSSQRSDDVQDALRALPLTRESNCRTWTAQLEPVDVTLPNDGHGSAALAMSLQDGSAIVASVDGYYYRVWATGRVEDLPRSWPRAPRAMHAMADGTLWLFDGEGVLHRGSIDAGFEVVAAGGPAAPEGVLAALAGPRDSDTAFELFVATSSKMLARFDGAAWEVLDQQPTTNFFVPVVAWLGPGHAMAPGFGGRVVEYRDTELIRHLLPGQASPIGISQVPGVGVLVGSTGGLVYVYVQDDAEWRLHGDPGFEEYTLLLNPLPGRGLLVGGMIKTRAFRFGFSQWLPELGYCEPEQIDEPAAAMVAMDPSTYLLVTFTSILTVQSFDVSMLRVAQPPATCAPQ